MNIKQLRYFVAVVETGSYTAAARREGISQPGMSQQIRALERSLGGPLTEISGRGVSLTSAGRLLYAKARALVSLAERTEQETRSAVEENACTERIYTAASYGYANVPGLITRRGAADPNGRVQWFEDASQSELEYLVRTTPGAVGLGAPPTPGIFRHVCALPDEEFVVVGHDLPGNGRRLTEEDLGRLFERPWIEVRFRHAASTALRQLADSVGATPAIAGQTGRVEQAVRLCMAGAGLALLPESAVSDARITPYARLNPPLRRPVAAFAMEFTPLLEELQTLNPVPATSLRSA